MGSDSHPSGVAVTHDIKGGAYTLVTSKGSFVFSEWTWGERKALIRDSIVGGAFDPAAFSALFSKSMFAPALPQQGDMALLGAALRILSVPEISRALPISTAQAFLVMRLGWKITDIDTQPARDLDELIWFLLPEPAENSETVDDGWTRIIIADDRAPSYPTLGNGPGKEDLANVFKSLAILGGASPPCASVPLIAAGWSGMAADGVKGVRMAKEQLVREPSATDEVDTAAHSKLSKSSPAKSSFACNLQPFQRAGLEAPAQPDTINSRLREPMPEHVVDGAGTDFPLPSDSIFGNTGKSTLESFAETDWNNREPGSTTIGQSASSGEGFEFSMPFRLKRPVLHSERASSNRPFAGMVRPDKGTVPLETASSGMRTTEFSIVSQGSLDPSPPSQDLSFHSGMEMDSIRSSESPHHIPGGNSGFPLSEVFSLPGKNLVGAHKGWDTPPDRAEVSKHERGCSPFDASGRTGHPNPYARQPNLRETSALHFSEADTTGKSAGAMKDTPNPPSELSPPVRPASDAINSDASNMAGSNAIRLSQPPGRGEGTMPEQIRGGGVVAGSLFELSELEEMMADVLERAIIEAGIDFS